MEAMDTAPQWDTAVATLKALADPVRLRLFTTIASSAAPVCVCHLPDLGVTQPTVSHHLRRLKDADLIDCHRRGTWVHYWATPHGQLAAHAIAQCIPGG